MNNIFRKLSGYFKVSLCGIGALLVFFSCSDYLDKDVRVATNLDYEEVFKDPYLAPGFLNNAYNHLPDGFNRAGGSALLAAASDEAKHSDAGSSIQLFNNNAVSPSYNPDDVWADMYTGIRKCNIFLKELDGLIAEYNSIPETSRDYFRGQALFLRAFFHFELLKRYQNIVYVDTVLDPFNEEEIYAFRQLTFREAVEKIAADCDSAAVLLPDKNTDETKGRPTKAAPLAIKSRMYLYAASPLNNPENDRSLWEKAEEAAKNIYDSRSAFGLALQSSYPGVFTTPYNGEIIFATEASNRNDIETANYPISYQGQGYTNPSQDLVDAYVMRATFYANPMNGYDPESPYTNREARFAATILCNDVTFKETKVESYVGGKDGLFATSTATKTGYYLRKYLVPSINLEKGETARRPWVLYRYAEVILNYAEARNEVLDAPDKTVHDLMNLIRNRAGLRPFQGNAANPYIQTKDEMREYIKRERRIELAMEEHRFWDLRRWKDAETVLNKPLRGMQIEKTADGTDAEGNTVYKFVYTPFEVEQRVFDAKFYWYPIPRSEILKYRSKGVELKQNTGWE